MTGMNSKDDWRDTQKLINHLARELARGRLALILGAGISTFYGLPEWKDLVNRIASKHKEPLLELGDDAMDRIAVLKKRYYDGQNREFLRDVRSALYEGLTLDFEKIRKNDTLAAIGALVMASKRGNASKVVTFNFDDLLETYLEYHGFVAGSIHSERHWAGSHDVSIYHPHGFLPLSSERGPSESLVLGKEEFLRIMETRPDNLWRSLMQTLLRTHTFIYIGLSGADPNLQSLVVDLSKHHAAGDERLAFHGVRLTRKTDRTADAELLLEEWGVFNCRLDSYDELPTFLFSICQEARRIRLERDA